MSSTHTTSAAPGSANYSGIGALIGTLTGLALAVSKHKVLTYLLSPQCQRIVRNDMRTYYSFRANMWKYN